MTLNELEVLQLLKDGLIEAAEIRGLKLTENAFGSKRWSKSEKRFFYLLDYRNNLFVEPKPKTKLGTGVDAVRSSAAMIFNLLGENDFLLDNKIYSEIEYEKGFLAIKDDNDEPHEAQLDAVFYSSDNSEMYAVEAKLLEWKDSPKNLAESYLHADKYITKGEEVQTFIDYFKSLISQEKDRYGRYKHNMKRYDSIQMLIHTLALYNHFTQKKSSPVRKLTLQNVVWKYDCDEYETEVNEAYLFLKEANERFVPLFNKIGIDFSIQYSSFQDFKKRIDFSNDSKRFEYLKRYEIEAKSE